MEWSLISNCSLLATAALPLLDAGVHELFDLAAVKTDDVVVVLALVQFEYRGRAFEMMARDQARRLELGQHPVDGRKPDIFVRLQQMLVDVFRAHVARRRGAEDLENLDARQRDLEPRLAQITGFHVLHLVCWPQDQRRSQRRRGFQYDARRIITHDRLSLYHHAPHRRSRLSRLPLTPPPDFLARFAACVHRIDIQQGNFLDAEDIDRVAVGMTRVQVRSLLGTPMVADPFQVRAGTTSIS